MPTIFIKDLVEILIEEYSPKIGKNPEDIKIEIIGPRLGEKINEVLISPDEYLYIYEFDNNYILCSQENRHNSIKNAKKINNFGYSSDNNTDWLSVDDLKKLI